jgi:hypothetical protein
MHARRNLDASGNMSRSAREPAGVCVGQPVRLSPHASASDLEAICDRALRQYGARVLDNVDLSRLDGIAARAFVIAGALMERGDARAFALGRKILSSIET